MNKFTPGKWVKRKMVGVGLPGQVGYAIDYNEDQEQVVDYVYEEADADLICAAKDLLEALEAISGQLAIDGFESGTTYGPLCISALAAIARARGEA
jgi:hypothetical protein